MVRRRPVAALIAMPLLLGCAAGGFIGSMMQAAEDQMLIEKLAEYDDLADRSVAVVIDTDLAVHYEFPGIAGLIAEGVATRLAANVKTARVMHPAIVSEWQFRTPQWNALSTRDIAGALGVDRVVFIDLQEYRLTPPGNRWLWEARCNATIGIIEADGYEQDGFSDTYEIQVVFPRRPSVLAHDEAREADIARGVLQEFIRETSWLFYMHQEPKHPDRYRPDLEVQS